MPRWAYLYEHPGADPTTDRSTLSRDGVESVMVPVPSPEAAVDVARQLVAEGVGLIELCGGFSTAAAAQVADAVGDRVPVGHVTFSVDAVPLAAAYAAAFEEDQTGPGASVSG